MRPPGPGPRMRPWAEAARHFAISVTAPGNGFDMASLRGTVVERLDDYSGR